MADVVTLEEIAGLVRETMRGKLPADFKITSDTELAELGLSSLQISDIVFTLEEKYEVEFDAARAADATTIGDMVNLANESLLV